MNKVNKHTAIRDFVQQFVDDRFLQFESIEFVTGARSVVPNYGDNVERIDILGNKYKSYTFTFIAIQDFDRGSTDFNEQNMMIMDSFNDWIVEKEENGEYPNFGDNCINYRWELLQNMGNLAQIDESLSLAKYMLTCKLNYTERE